MKLDLPYLSAEITRHGKTTLYVRRNGRRVRISEEPGTTAFNRAYAEAVDRLAVIPPATVPEGKPRAAKGTLAWLGERYFGSPEFRALDQKSRNLRRQILETCFAEPRKPGAQETFGDCPIHFLGSKQIRTLRDRKAATPGAANNRLKYLSSMFSWAIENEDLAANPARDVKPLKYATDGFHPWSMSEVRQFEERWPVGTKPRLALALLLFTGARRGDMVTFGKQHVRDGWLRYVPSKTRYRRLKVSEKPFLPVLASIVEQSPCGDLTFLVTEYGRPFSAAGFGNWFREKCNAAGLPQCSAHGLRKAGATLLAEAGATDRQMMAIFDWTDSKQATTYTRAAESRRLAGAAMHLLDGTNSGTSVSHLETGLPVAPKKDSSFQ